MESQSGLGNFLADFGIRSILTRLPATEIKVVSPQKLAAKRRERKEESSRRRKCGRIKQESIIDALSNDGVVDDKSFEKAIRA